MVAIVISELSMLHMKFCELSTLPDCLQDCMVKYNYGC